MTADEIARLHELAENATPGAWEVLPYWFQLDGELEPSSASVVVPRDSGKRDWVIRDEIRTADAAYIAAIDPPTLLRLLDERDALIEERNRAHDLLMEARARLREAGMVGGES